jgi:hypothetical protein
LCRRIGETLRQGLAPAEVAAHEVALEPIGIFPSATTIDPPTAYPRATMDSLAWYQSKAAMQFRAPVRSGGQCPISQVDEMEQTTDGRAELLAEPQVGDWHRSAEKPDEIAGARERADSDG